MKKLLTFLMMSILAIGVGWADTSTLTFTAACGGSGTADDGASWTVTSDGTESTYDSTKGIHYGANKSAVQYIQLSTSSISGTITQVKVNASTASDVSATVGVKVGSTDFTTGSNNATTASLTSTATTYTFTGSASGTITVLVTKPSSANKALYVKSIEVTYTSSTPTTTYAIYMGSMSNGSVSASPNPAAEGATVTLTASPATGYQLSTISATNHSTSADITLSGSGNTRTFTMPAAEVNVAATFTERPTYAVVIGSMSNGTVTASPSPTWAGNEVTLTVTPSAGYVLNTLTVTGNTSGNEVTVTNNKFTMPDEPVTVNATFVKSSSVTFDATVDTGTSPLEKGVVTFICSNGALNNGSEYRLYKNSTTTFTVPEGYLITKIEFTGVSGNAVSGFGNTTGLTTSGNDGVWEGSAQTVSFTASSAQVRCTLIKVTYSTPFSVEIDENITGGTVTASPSTAVEGAEVTLTVTPDAGYAIGTVSYTPEGGSATTITPVNGVYSFTMPAANVTVSATFTAIHYTINLDVQPAAASTAGCTIPLPSQASVFLEDNVSKSTVGQTVTFRMHTVTGWVVPSDYLPTLTYSGGTCTVTRKSTQDDGATFEFTMPAADVTISATFTDYAEPLWLLGNNLENASMPYAGGTPMTYANGNYTLTTYFKGHDLSNGVYYGSFCFTKKNDATGWDDAYPNGLNTSGKRIGPSDGNNIVINADYPTKDLGTNSNSFWIPAGIYTITVNKACTSVTITPITGYGVTLTPNGGDVETGNSVTVSETLSAALKAINSDLAADCATAAYSFDGNNYTDGSSYTWATADVGSKTFYGKAYYGHIETAAVSANFTVTKADNSNKYQLITSTDDLVSGKKYILVYEDPDNNGSGARVAGALGSNQYLASQSSGFTFNSSSRIVELQSGHDVEIFTLTGDNTNGWTFTSSNGTLFATAAKKLAYDSSDSGAESVATIAFNSEVISNSSVIGTDAAIITFGSYGNFKYNTSSPRFLNYDSEYTASMRPINLYKQVKTGDYTITYATNLTGGSVSGATDADADEDVEVIVTTTGNHVVNTVTYSYGGNTYTITPNANGKYIFTMPAANVTVNATFTPAYTVTCATVTGGTISASPEVQLAYGRVDLTFTPDADYELVGTPTYVFDTDPTNPHNVSSDANGWYIEMPNHDITVTATFALIHHSLAVQHIGGSGTVTGLPTDAQAGDAVSLTITPSSSYIVKSVEVKWDGGALSSSDVTVTQNSNGTYSVAFYMPGKDVTIAITYFDSEDYELLTDLDDIEDGETYLFVNPKTSDGTTTYYVMSSYDSGGYYDYVTAVPDANNYIQSTDAMNLVTFTKGTGDNAGKFAVHTSGGYLSTSSINASEPYYMTITLDVSNPPAPGDTYAATFGSTGFQFNSSNPRWKNYTSSQTKVFIYKVANKNQVRKPVISDAVQKENTFIGKDDISITCATDEATIEYKVETSTDGGTTWTTTQDWATYSETFEISTLTPGALIRVSAHADKDGMTQSNEATAIYECVRPDAPSFGERPAGAYVEPQLVYPKRSTANYSAYGKTDQGENVFSYYYTLDGTTPTLDAEHLMDGTTGARPVGKTSNGKYVYLDHNVNLQVVVVLNGIPSLPAGGEYTFTVGAPSFSVAGGSYDNEQNVRLGTMTGTANNPVNASWSTVIYYTTGESEFTFNAATGEVTSEGWTAYDAVNNPYVSIPAGHTTTLRAVTLSNYMNEKAQYVASTETQATYVIGASKLGIVFQPKPGEYVNEQTVVLSATNAIDNVHIFYNITNNTPFDYLREGDVIAWNDDAGWVEYTAPVTVSSDTHFNVFALDDRQPASTDGEASREADYIIGVQPVHFSPLGAHYLEGESGYSADDYSHRLYSGEQTLEMYSVSPRSRVYYKIAEATGTTPPAAPAAPTTWSDPTAIRYDGQTITLEVGKSYAVTAVAYVGTKPSTARTVYYTITEADDNLLNIKAMNDWTGTLTGSGNSQRSSSDYTLSNPYQVVYMSTWRHNGSTPEFAYVRDNSGYGLVYFGNEATTFDNYKKYNMGDWLPGDATTARIAIWNDGFHNEFGSSNKDVSAWPSSSIGHTAILPEYTTCAEILAGWDSDNYEAGSTDYSTYVKENNYWGHYVHLRKNTIEVLTEENTVGAADSKRHKHQGIITGETGTQLTYYDVFYNFSGFGSGDNATEDYGPDYFENEQANGATFDVYGIVLFYGPLVSNRTKWGDYPAQPFEIAPIDFLKIYKPRIYMDGVITEGETTVHESKQVTLECASVGAQVWYKTSEMEDFELYTEPFTMSNSTTIETYSTLPTKYDDELESVITTLVVNIGSVEQPVISPESVVKAIGAEAVNCSIACATEGATIYYTTDGSDPSDETNAERHVYSGAWDISETTTVRAIAYDDGYYSTEAESRTYTFVYSNGIVFDLVTSESQLDEHSVYIIVNQENHMAMSNVQKANNRGASGVMFVNEETKTQVYGNADVALFTLHKVGDNWEFYTTNGFNSNSVGYLHVGSGNSLITKTEQDASGNADAEVTILPGNKARIHYLYNSEVDRYLRFWKRDNLFNCYTTESNGDVYLYRVMATPLATIEEMGTTVEGKNQYTIADELVCVWQYDNHLWCKDQGNVSIWRTAPLEGQEDFMMNHSTYGANRLNETWDQSNWVRIDFDDNTSGLEAAQHCVGHLLDAATISALFIDKNNYTMSLPGDGEQELTKVNEVTSKSATAEQLELNVYGPANFLEKNLILKDGDQGALGDDGEYYYLVNPKVQEVCTITWAVWDATNELFVIPADDGSNNPHNFDGAITLDASWKYNDYGNQSAKLSDGQAYTFTAVIESVGNGYGPARISGKDGQTQTVNANVKISPLDFNASQEQIVTDVQAVKTGREVAGVTYYNVAGQMSKTPFEGSVNIVVTKYTDGTKKTAKVVF